MPHSKDKHCLAKLLFLFYIRTRIVPNKVWPGWPGNWPDNGILSWLQSRVLYPHPSRPQPPQTPAPCALVQMLSYRLLRFSGSRWTLPVPLQPCSSFWGSLSHHDPFPSWWPSTTVTFSTVTSNAIFSYIKFTCELNLKTLPFTPSSSGVDFGGKCAV